MKTVLAPGPKNQQLKRLVLGGMGGIGKTQLAIAYANNHHNEYSSALWLNASSQTTLEADYQRIARQIFVGCEVHALPSEQLMTHVHRWLSDTRNNRWLLILDNYDDPDQYKLQQYLPHASHGAIIITTRRPDRVMGSKVHVGPLKDVAESLEILATRSRRGGVTNGR